MTTLQDAIDHILRMRGVEEPCKRCHGLGVRTYSNGSTWRGGAGTAKAEKDVCDLCWGTGDMNRIGVDLRKLRDEDMARVTVRAMSLFSDKAGCDLEIMRAGVLAVAKELDGLAKTKNKPRPPWFSLVAEQLAKVLREGVEAAQKREAL